MLTPFVAYLAAERLGVSGVLAVVVAGLHLGWRLPELLSFQTRLRGGPVWEMVEFLLTGFVFILIGLQLPEVLGVLSGKSIPVHQLIWYALLISLAVILIRILLGSPRNVSAPPAFQETSQPRSLSTLAARHHPGLDRHARSGLARSGHGASAHDADRRALSGPRSDSLPHLHCDSGHARRAGIEPAASHPLARRGR